MTPSPLLQLPNTYRAFYGAFSSLRPFQINVIDPVLSGRDVILQAATGSGKTEAILAPCLERVICASEPETILYVVPTRALVHDLRRRLEPVLHDRLGLQLGIRTGDVKRLPSGWADLLLTTPESLDVMLGSRNQEIRAFLKAVTTIAVDEVHQLVQGYRGRHLAYLMQRLERLNRRRLQKIALSATLSGPDAICEGLGLHPDAIWISNPVQRQIRPHLIHLKREPAELIAFIDDLALRFNARKILLFANSRSRCDELFSGLSQRGHFQHTVFLHYSNLKLEQRQEVERQFQRRKEALCIATSTLELGIDVGDVDSVILYEPPESVTTFLQRLGRAGRQSQTTTFWGICRGGSRAGFQLLQFLALYALAQHGEVEAARPLELPSVLAQQIVSTLYAHRQVSRGMLQNQFTAQAETVDKLIPALERGRWLRRQTARGRQTHWTGGWRYGQALRAHQIWSNFPESETPYVLQIEAEAVADLPPVIVRQLDPGDHVDLAGRCIRILEINDGERKVVRAELSPASETKPLYWVGTGPPVSWEVAQAMRHLLQPGYEPDTALAQGLFARTRALLDQQQALARRRVVLHNGIELSRTPLGLFRYATYLGTIGNLIVQRTIESHYGARIEPLTCSSDAMAVVCSDLIDWQQLSLPLSRDAFSRWTAHHLKAIQAAFEFSMFTRVLPRDLFIEEASDWLWDERLAAAFTHYREVSSEIAEGDPQHLEWDGSQDTEAREPRSELTYPGPEPSILSREKARLGIEAETQPMLPAVPATNKKPRALTGTMVGSYMQHQQCDRLLSFDLLPYNQQPSKRALVDSALGAIRAREGQAFEARVLAWLEQLGAFLVRVPEQDETGRRLTLQARQTQGVAYLRSWIESAGQDPCRPRVLGALAQPVFMVPSSSETSMPIDGVGIPDLIEVTVDDAAVVLTVVDVKDSATPRYSQKWQVAFYAALIQSWLQTQTFALPVRVAEHGFLWTRPEPGDTAPARHGFALEPYLEAFPQLTQHVADLLAQPVAEAGWHLQTHCATCAYVDTCYRQALSTDDTMLIPHLTPGGLLKLRESGLGTLNLAAEWAQNGAEDAEMPLDGLQAAHIGMSIRALVNNRAELLTPTTSLYPAQIGLVIYVHMLRDPRNGQPRAWVLHQCREGVEPEPPQCWIAVTEADIEACRVAFYQQLSQWWQADRHAHLVIFGASRLSQLRESRPAGCAPIDDIWQREPPRHTDLRQLLRQHFALPIPLQYTLSAVARVWQLTPEPPPSAGGSLLSDDDHELEGMLIDEPLREDQMDSLRTYLESHVKWQAQVWQICTQILCSDWMPNGLMDELAAGQGWQTDCVNFLQLQQQRRERDITAVQQLPLNERVARYRALGPLEFESTSLDDEGRFLAHFRLLPNDAPSRFRAGDFLRLNPVGSLDLQAGASVILAQFDPHARRLAVTARQGRLSLNQRLRYVLDEDLEDWTTPRVLHAVREGLSPGKHPHLQVLLEGRLRLPQPPTGWRWVRQWLPVAGLNARQGEALCLPFRSRLALIEGPPGTGKTHLLAWMLIALIQEAARAGRPMRLAVSALTHQAIDNVLRKVQQLLQGHPGLNCPARCLKWGRPTGGDDDGLTYVDQGEDVLPSPYLILGATGFGLYQLFDSRAGNFPAYFDWVIFDEASQMVLPQALLSLIYGKGQYIFCGDVHQLPPVIRGRHITEDESAAERSILAHLLETYPADVHVRLNETYRLNRELCALPSRLWYQGDLQPAADSADARLVRPIPTNPDQIDAILAPEQPVTLVLANHTTDEQQSAVEVEIIVTLAARLLIDDGIEAERLAILAPHRAQNNAIAKRLGQLIEAEQVELPVIDTVERLQGAERDVVLFSLTTSDLDHIESPFLNNPNRFNVSMTRARHKLVVVGSRVLFTRVPQTESGLLAHRCFTAYYHLCRERQALFEFDAFGR